MGIMSFFHRYFDVSIIEQIDVSYCGTGRGFGGYSKLIFLIHVPHKHYICASIIKPSLLYVHMQQQLV